MKGRFDLGADYPEWDGFIFDCGILHHPYWRRGFTAGDLRSMFYHSQTVRILESELARAKRDLAAASAAQDAAESAAHYYRHQLALESRSGFMLARIADE